MLTGILCFIVAYFAKKYEESRKKAGAYIGVPHEIESLKAQVEGSEESKPYASLLSKVVTKPWTLVQGAVALTIVFIVMMAATRAGWGASTPYGIWVGQLLYGLGVPIESITNFTGHAVDKSPFTVPFFNNPTTIQNIGIMLGALTYLLLAGKFVKTFVSELRISFREVIFFAIGGLAMGVGTRLANGCNVGALYTPIASFSLSGWIFLVVMVIGAIVGNRVFRGKRC